MKFKKNVYDYKRDKKCSKQWRGSLKETMLIRAPRLQFFKDDIKITATYTSTKTKLKQQYITEVCKC